VVLQLITAVVPLIVHAGGLQQSSLFHQSVICRLQLRSLLLSFTSPHIQLTISTEEEEEEDLFAK